MSLFDIGGNYNGLGLQNVRVMKTFPGKLKKPVVLSARVPQSTSVCLVCPQVESKSLTSIAVSEQGGWKATKAMMSQITAESRKYLALASVCAVFGAIPVVVCKRGNVIWPKAEVREWCESWELKPLKMCSCKFGFDFHTWIGTLHVTAEYFQILMRKFGCKHKKHSCAPSSPSIDRIIELVSICRCCWLQFTVGEPQRPCGQACRHTHIVTCARLYPHTSQKPKANTSRVLHFRKHARVQAHSRSYEASE